MLPTRQLVLHLLLQLSGWCPNYYSCFIPLLAFSVPPLLILFVIFLALVALASPSLFILTPSSPVLLFRVFPAPLFCDVLLRGLAMEEEVASTPCKWAPSFDKGTVLWRFESYQTIHSPNMCDSSHPRDLQSRIDTCSSRPRGSPCRKKWSCPGSAGAIFGRRCRLR